MLRIHFTSEDLARVRFADRPRMAWELSGSVQLLQSRSGALVFDGWRRRVARGSGDRRTRAVVGVLTELFPDFTYFPDFLTPATGGGSIETLLDAILSTGRTVRRREHATLAGMKRLPPWWGRFADGDRAVEKAVGGALADYHRRFLGPVWPTVSGVLREHRDKLVDALLSGGAEGALHSLGRSVRWRPPVLEADYPVDRDVHLAGRGLEVVPTYFCWRMPVTMADPELPPTLVVPVERLPEPPGAATLGPDGRRAALRKLLGRTRATILDRAVGGATTADLRASAAVSAAAVSQHLNVLRDNGLIRSRRDGVHLLHETTRLGIDLLDRSDGASGRPGDGRHCG